MAEARPGATLTPPFPEFLPGWLRRQPWYLGAGVPTLRPIGFIRFQDPAGEVGLETHLVTDGAEIYQLPMTYRGAPMPGAAAAEALITTAEHSALGTRWIYDAVADPVWMAEIVRLVRTGGASDPSRKGRVGQAEANGVPLAAADLATGPVDIYIQRVLREGRPVDESGAAGLLMGAWQPRGPDTAPVNGCLAVLRRRRQR